MGLQKQSLVYIDTPWEIVGKSVTGAGSADTTSSLTNHNAQPGSSSGESDTCAAICRCRY